MNGKYVHRYMQPAYSVIRDKIASDECVILDGGVSTELQRLDLRDYHLSDSDLWGTWGLYHAPRAVLDVHRRYAAAGCDLITTNTWGIINAAKSPAKLNSPGAELQHWMDIARLGIGLARKAIETSGRTGHCSVAFSLSGDLDAAQTQGSLQLLKRVFAEDPPDLILVETLSLVPEDLSFPWLETILEWGYPVWLSFRRCRHGVCGVYGQHWGGPEGDLFGRSAGKFERLGVEALLINCLPISHVSGMIPWLRDFTDLPLGVYPNLGHYLDPDWKFDERVGPDDYADLALAWREEGAQIIGGCCGVMPEHIEGARLKLEGKRSGRPGFSSLAGTFSGHEETTSAAPPPIISEPWADAKDRVLFPLPFPRIVCEPSVFRPTPGSFQIWRYLFQQGIGEGKKCLDVGCGTGILTVQLALNGARLVEAIDVQQEAVANALTNAFRNDVSDRVQGKVVDLYAWLPEEKYEIIVASLYQMPVDPRGQVSGHRPADYWGRNLFDHLISLLPNLLEENGVAYVMQISALSQLRTAELLDGAGLQCKIVDFGFFAFSDIFLENLEQIGRVESQSDAFHLNFSEHNEMVLYLLEVTRKEEDQTSRPDYP